MDKPKCSFCGEKHWPREPHIFQDGIEEVKAKQALLYTKEVKLEEADAELIKAKPWKHCPTCTCQGRQVYESNAERQRAYRERKKSK